MLLLLRHNVSPPWIGHDYPRRTKRWPPILTVTYTYHLHPRLGHMIEGLRFGSVRPSSGWSVSGIANNFQARLIAYGFRFVKGPHWGQLWSRSTESFKYSRGTVLNVIFIWYSRGLGIGGRAQDKGNRMEKMKCYFPIKAILWMARLMIKFLGFWFFVFFKYSYIYRGNEMCFFDLVPYLVSHLLLDV